ncbi:MAG: hypothetical protein IPG92_06310 [Flavobacteriales bacterium]|nr:hypothetical protein [Flavobacteriales bacterium]
MHQLRQEVQVMVVVQQMDAVPHAALVLKCRKYVPDTVATNDNGALPCATSVPAAVV